VPARHVLLALAVAVLWGVNFVLIDIGLRDFPPLLFVALRYGLVAVPAVFFIARPPIPLRYVVSIGLFVGAATQGLLFVSMHVGMPAGLASLVIQAQALFTVALAVAFLGESPGPRQLAGGAIAVGGIGVIAAARSGHHVPLGALALCIAGAAAWGVGNVLIRVAQPPNALALLVWSSLVATVPLTALSLWLEGPARVGDALSSASLAGIGALLYVVVVATVFGFGSWTWLLRRYPASKVAPFSLLVPVFGIASAWAALGERPDRLELIGAGIVMCGLGLLSVALRMPGRAIRPASVR
jgi:O-acetylserine/cysteine efflux transporter